MKRHMARRVGAIASNSPERARRACTCACLHHLTGQCGATLSMLVSYVHGCQASLSVLPKHRRPCNACGSFAAWLHAHSSLSVCVSLSTGAARVCPLSLLALPLRARSFLHCVTRRRAPPPPPLRPPPPPPPPQPFQFECPHPPPPPMCVLSALSPSHR